MRATPIAITIVALDGPAPATLSVLGLGLLGRMRTIRTRGVVADRIAGSPDVVGATGCLATWRRRWAQYVSVDDLKSRPCANALAVCPLAFHSFTRSDHFVSVSVMPIDDEAAGPHVECVLHASDTEVRGSCKAVPLIVHPSRVFEHASTPHPQARVITKEKLEEFRAALRAFAVGVAQLPKYGTAEEVAQLIAGCGLVSGGIAERFSTTFKVK
jgi:hypothetical protein